MNNKGYTLLELVVVLAMSSVLLYSVFFIPIDLLKKNSEYTEFSDNASDVYLLRKVIANDLSNENVKKIDENRITIGNSEYYFGDNVKRNSVSITEHPYNFEVNGNTLKIFNDNSSIEYNVGSSFSRVEGDYIE